MSLTDARFGTWMHELRAIAPAHGLTENALRDTRTWRYYFEDGCTPATAARHLREDAPYYPPRVGVRDEGIE
jgi:hypothetical protein